MSLKKEVWICDTSNPKYQKIKMSFIESMNQQTKDGKINYYDFLLVAKKLSFRFEESSHLMALKNYFAKNKNLIPIKKMSDVLFISQESIHSHEDKIIVKFNVPETEFAPIKQQTHQDEENYKDDDEEDNHEENFEKIGNQLSNDQEKEINEKMSIILSIKVDQMEKKLRVIINHRENHTIFNVFDENKHDEICYEEFKKGMLLVISQIREKVKISQDDIKTIYYILDQDKLENIRIEQIYELKNIDVVLQKMKEFYKTRINRDMVKNTLFKLGKIKNNSIQIYQVKNASLLEFENIEKSILNQNQNYKLIKQIKLKTAKVPHFGPLKGAAMANKHKHSNSTNYYSNTQLKGENQIKKQREKIEKILRLSKEEKRKDKNGDTVASKLRSLFIHKVILPRQKMLEEEKQRYVKNKIPDYELSIRNNR